MAFSGTSVRRAGGNPRRCHRIAQKCHPLAILRPGRRERIDPHRWVVEGLLQASRRRVFDGDAMRRRAADVIAGLGLRADGARNLLEVAEAYIARARPDGTTCPTWPVVMAETDLARATVARHTDTLQKAGLMVVVQTGSTPRYRGRAAVLTGPEDRNDAAIYLLVAPGLEDDPLLSETPCSSGFDLVGLEPAPAQPREGRRQRRPGSQPRPECRGGGKRAEEKRAARSGGHAESRRRLVHCPRRALGREWRVQHAEKLQAKVPVLRRLSAAHVASLIRPHLEAGWTDLDLLHAIDHDQDGSQHWQTAAVRSPAGWLAWRLGRWRAADGTLQRSNRQRMLAAAGYGVPAPPTSFTLSTRSPGSEAK